MFLLLTVSAAQAFCGTYVAVGDHAPTNSGSFVGVVRQQGMTTLTMANDVHGEFGDFAMVIPVPEVLPESAIHVIDPAVFAHVDTYSGPRLVSYTCEDFAPKLGDESDTGMDWDAGASDTADAGGVEVEAQYVVGEYDIVLLSSTESGALLTWLQDHGYQVPTSSQTLLGEYIAGGSYFLAAQVRADAGLVDGATLSPLQLTYTDPGGTLPIRLGTLNSPGVQDLTIFGITDTSSGQMAIANYPESKVEADCMLPENANFGTFVDGLRDEALPTVGEAHWITEYSWANGNCDPCTAQGNLTETDLVSLGFEPDYHYGYNYQFTRLHMRYAPDQVTQDIVLYESGISTTSQLRYIEYLAELEDLFPVCGQGMVEDPGSCAHPIVREELTSGTGCGCSGTATGGSLFLGAGLGLVAALRRRRAAGGAR